VIKIGASILLVSGFIVFCWFFVSRQRDEALTPDDAEEQIFIIEENKIVEVLQADSTPKVKKETLPPARKKKERIIRGDKIYQKSVSPAISRMVRVSLPFSLRWRILIF